MSDLRSGTSKPANANTASGTEHSATPCEVCGAGDTRPYTFYFGEQQKRRGYGSGSIYTVKGSRVVHICDNCVFQQRLWQAFIFIISTAIAIVSAIILGTRREFTLWGWNVGFIPVLGFLCGGYFAITRLIRVFKNRDDVGAYRAIRLRQKELEKLGYRYFWINRPN